ncbi:MAG: sortase [Clostridia bacterium]|nr:sortase [Clostridia bacterium]MBQ6708262.1 sortase [Clostridia bacterium]
MRKKIGIILISIGLALIFFSAALLLYNTYESNKAQKQSDILVQSIQGEIIKSNEETDPFDEEMKVVEIDGYGYIGYLTIPDLDLNLPVMSDWDYTRLKISPCRYYGSTKTDNLVIAAHNYRSHFGYLGQLKPNNKILFTDMDGKNISYTVTSVEILQPYDTDKVKDTGDDLILYTCTYGGRTRIVVRCSAL